ncbi:MAG: hypothetical protein ACREL7_11910 [Longimicrobiales bacterium]
MECGHARQLLWPPEQPRIAGPEIVAAREHLENCAACRTHFAIDGALAEVRAGLREAVPSREIRERVFEAVARGRTASVHGSHQPWLRRRRTVVSGFLILGVAIAAVTGLVLRPGQSPNVRADFIEDYMRLAVREDHIVTADPAEVRRFLLRELGSHVQPIDAPGLRITGAEVCLLDGRRGAVIRYRSAGGIVTYYLLPAPGIDDRSPAPEHRRTGGSAALVTWAKDGIEHALVGPLPPDSLLAVARHAN